jgi:hypothetical protein
MSQFQNPVGFEIGFTFAPVSSIGFAEASKPCANAAIDGNSFKMRLHFKRASNDRGISRLSGRKARGSGDV